MGYGFSNILNIIQDKSYYTYLNCRIVNNWYKSIKLNVNVSDDFILIFNRRLKYE